MIPMITETLRPEHADETKASGPSEEAPPQVKPDASSSRVTDSTCSGARGSETSDSGSCFAQETGLLRQKAGAEELQQLRAQSAMTIVCFPRQADEIELAMRSGVQAVHSILNSTAMPVLFEAVLLLANAINDRREKQWMSPLLANAINDCGEKQWMSLDSVARLAQTGAFDFLVPHLLKTQEPTWLLRLTSELEACRAAWVLDCSASSEAVEEIAAHISAVDERLHLFALLHYDELPALASIRFKRFMADAVSRVAMLRSLEKEMQAAAEELRRYFAEPPDSTLSDMLQSLVSILHVLPTADAEPEPEPFRFQPLLPVMEAVTSH